MTESAPNAAFEAFRKHYSDLIRAIQDPDVLLLACDLYSEGILAQTVLDVVNVVGFTPVQKKMTLLSALKDQIALDPTKLDTLLEAFRKRPHMVELAERLAATYRMSLG